jgi:hypothetical protein
MTWLSHSLRFAKFGKKLGTAMRQTKCEKMANPLPSRDYFWPIVPSCFPTRLGAFSFITSDEFIQ